MRFGKNPWEKLPYIAVGHAGGRTRNPALIHVIRVTVLNQVLDREGKVFYTGVKNHQGGVLLNEIKRVSCTGCLWLQSETADEDYDQEGTNLDLCLFPRGGK